jgi:hypothetical protein
VASKRSGSMVAQNVGNFPKRLLAIVQDDMWLPFAVQLVLVASAANVYSSRIDAIF